ncbi:hypothetical protein WN944_023623 [Citrus x changshan-huyou]|uniref:MADS-box domain-containing protein n=1 Tax=Citrus x changshan-huyou TaxID=2935761 RepID=A0AAP0N337_9ROSI
MGKKIEIKKIADAKARQVTYAKRKKSLIKKAREISVACGIDLVLITFSPTKRGRSTKFCSMKRIEDLIQRYLNLSPEKKFHEVNNCKVHCEANICKDLERRITRTSVETEIVEDQLRFYEPDPKDDLSSSNIILLERNLKQALQQVQNKKNELIKSPSRKYKKRNQLKKDKAKQDDHLTKERQTKNPGSGSLQMQHDHLISDPFSFPECSFEELLAHVRRVAAAGNLQFPPTYSSSVQHQPIIGDQISSLGVPNQQFNFSPVGLEAPMQGFHQSYPTQTHGHNWTNANNQNVVPHTSHFQANPSKVDFTDTNNIFSTIQNSDHFNIKFDQPFNFERVPNTIAAITIDSNNNNSEHLNFTNAVTGDCNNNGSVVDNNNNNGSSIENNGSSDADPIAQIPPTIDNTYIQNVMSPTFQFEADFNEVNFTDGTFNTILSNTNQPLNSKRVFSPVDYEPIVTNNNNNDNGSTEKNGGSDAALCTQVNLLPNSNEAEKGNKENNWSLDSDDLKWAEDLNWEDLRILLAEF